MGEVAVRAAVEADWPAARDVRLRALADAPHAFASTLGRESAFDELEWRRRVAPGTWMLAWAGPDPVGLAVGYAQPGSPAAERDLVGLWVAPEHRGRGVTDRLVAAVADWAAAAGAARLGLWVVDGNERARRAYARLGFVSTGMRQPLPGRVDVVEERLVRPLAQPR